MEILINNKWMPYKEYLIYKEKLDREEKKILKKNGLGWLLKFLQKSKSSLILKHFLFSIYLYQTLLQF